MEDFLLGAQEFIIKAAELVIGVVADIRFFVLVALAAIVIFSVLHLLLLNGIRKEIRNLSMYEGNEDEIESDRQAD